MRFQKDLAVRLYEEVNEQDSIGSWHTHYHNLGRFFCHYRPISITSQHTNAAALEIADAVLTLNKPLWFDTVDLTRLWTTLRGRVYHVTRVEDMEGKRGGDVKLYIQQDPHIRVSDFESKIDGDNTSFVDFPAAGIKVADRHYERIDN